MSPLNHYAQAQVSTSSPGELVVLLYRGAVRFAAKARLQLQGGQTEAAHNSLIRAQQIVVELMLGLKPGEDQASSDLYALHGYIHQVLCDANFKKDVALIDEALRHLRDLLQTWEQIALPNSRPAQSAGVVQIDRHC